MANPNRALYIGLRRPDEELKKEETPMPPVSVAVLEERLEGHEKVCADRYTAINARLSRLEKVMLWCAATLLTGMGAIIITVLFKL